MFSIVYSIVFSIMFSVVFSMCYTCHGLLNEGPTCDMGRKPGGFPWCFFMSSSRISPRYDTWHWPLPHSRPLHQICPLSTQPSANHVFTTLLHFTWMRFYWFMQQRVLPQASLQSLKPEWPRASCEHCWGEETPFNSQIPLAEPCSGGKYPGSFSEEDVLTQRTRPTAKRWD